MLTEPLQLVDIPGVTADLGSHWKIKALEINGIAPAALELARLFESEPKDFKKLRTALRVAVNEEHCTHEQYVKRSVNYAGAYEAKAKALNSRMMFFYSEREQAVVCTNLCWKSSDNQDKAFKDCAGFKKVYDHYHASKARTPKKPR